MKHKIKYVIALLTVIFSTFFFLLQTSSTTTDVSTYECPTFDDISFTS